MKQKLKARFDGEKSMISEVKYSIRMGLPGKGDYDYEVIEVKNIQDEAGEIVPGQDLLGEAITLARKNLAMSKARRKAKEAK